MKLLVFGKTGQVASEMQRAVPAAWPGEWQARYLGRDAADLCDPAACAAIIAASDADLVVNAAAYTAVDAAEDDEATALLVNGDAPAAMALAAARKGVPFFHLSTDYVFGGMGNAPFKPGDPTGPLGAYGRTKLAGELGVRAAGGRSVILRTSWVFSSHGSNFVKTMLRLGAERDTISVVADQTGGPTPAGAIASAIGVIGQALVQGAPGGTYHFSGAPDVSWAQFARAIMAQAGHDCRVDEIDSASYPTAAQRPFNSRLDCADLERAFGIERPRWDAYLGQVIRELK